MKALSRLITRRLPRAPGRRSRILGLALAAALVAGAAVAVAFHVPGGGGHLAAVGPTSSVHGFPVWYEDGNGLTLDLCIDPDNALCLAAPLPDPAQPISFPGNFPDESFWFNAGAAMDTNGGQARLVLGLEAAFAGGAPAAGDQISFGRVRYVIDNLQAGATYTITSPYGTDEVVAAEGGARSIVFTEDIGIAPGSFTGALQSRIGPFLTWDPLSDAPLGYIGDPAVPHRVVGSPFGTNVFRIEGPGVGAAGSQFLCAPPATDCIQTDLFTVSGKISTVAGVDGARATYSTSPAGETTIDVFARSKPLQDIQVSGGGLNPTALRGDDDSYFGRVVAPDPTPTEITLTNTGDVPPSVKTVPVDDLVAITGAVYDATASTLTIAAVSSDKRSSPPSLTAVGLGALVAGSLTLADVAVPPVSVTVTSSAGGTDTEPVEVIGGAFVPIPIAASAGADQTVQQGDIVSLDGNGSTGAISGWAWTRLSGPAPVTLTGANTATPSFTAPSTPGDYVFELTVTGTAGSSTDTVTVTVASVAAPVANAGPDQTVPQGTLVTLNGSASTGASTYSWAQVSGLPVVTLSSANTASPRFTFPVVVGQSPILVFRLTVTGPGGTRTDDVQVSSITDTLAVSRARLTTRRGEWTVVGTATVLAQNTVTIHLGPSLGGPVLGTATVDATGAWAFRGTGDPATTVSIESSRGGQLLEVPVQVRR